MGIEEIIIEMARQEGEAKGNLKKDTFFVESLLRSTDFTEERIALLAGVEIDFVKSSKARLGL